MRHIRVILFALVPLTTIPAHGQEIAVTGVTVVDVAHGTVLPQRTVMIAEGRITAVVPAVAAPIPADAIRVDGSGRFLIPGLWDMHVHASSDGITRRILFPLYLAHGITGVRNMSGGCLERCGPLTPTADMTLRRRADVVEGRLAGPRVVTTGPIIHGAAPGDSSTVEAPATEEHGRALARIHKERGVDMIKVYDELPAPAFRGLAAEGARLGLPVVGHVPWEVGSLAAADAGMRSIEHLYPVIDDCSTTVEEQRPAVVAAYQEGNAAAVFDNLFKSLQNFSEDRCKALYARLATFELWQVPTLVAGYGDPSALRWRDHPGRRYLPPEEEEYWRATEADEAEQTGGTSDSWARVRARIERITLDMYRAGVPVLAGSDALALGVYPGFGLHEELERLVEVGFTPREALHAATVEPARFLGATDSLGRVQAGMAADLVLLDANPLVDIRNTRRIHAVIARGKLYTRDDLDGLLEAAAAAAR